MSYEEFEASIETAEPVFLYSFLRYYYYDDPMDDAWRMASTLEDIDALGETWTGTAIRHSNIVFSGQAEKDSVRIELPATNEFARALLAPDALLIATFVDIYRGHRGDPDDEYRVRWRGRVTRPTIERNTVTLTCEPVWTGQKRTGLHRSYQRTCPHSLYYGECRADRLTVEEVIDIEYLGGTAVQCNSTLAYAEDRYASGFVVNMATGEQRTVRSIQGGIINMSRPMGSLVDETQVFLYRGCDKSMTACAEFENLDNESETNIENFGGFPWIPTGGKNPFGGTPIL